MPSAKPITTDEWANRCADLCRLSLCFQLRHRLGAQVLWAQLAELLGLPAALVDVVCADQRGATLPAVLFLQLKEQPLPLPLEGLALSSFQRSFQQLLATLPRQARVQALEAAPSLSVLLGLSTVSSLKGHLATTSQQERREEERGTRYGMTDRRIYVRRFWPSKKPSKLPFALGEPVSLEDVIRATKVSRKTAHEWRVQAYNPNSSYMEAGFSYDGEQYTINLA